VSVLRNLFGQLKTLLCEVDNHREEQWDKLGGELTKTKRKQNAKNAGRPSSDFLLDVRKASREAQKKFEDKRELERLEALGKARELLPEFEEEIKQRAEDGYDSLYKDIGRRMTWGGISLYQWPGRDDIGNALVKKLEELGFKVSGRWVEFNASEGYVVGCFRIWIDWQ